MSDLSRYNRIRFFFYFRIGYFFYFLRPFFTVSTEPDSFRFFFCFFAPLFFYQADLVFFARVFFRPIYFIGLFFHPVFRSFFFARLIFFTTSHIIPFYVESDIYLKKLPFFLPRRWSRIRFDFLSFFPLLLDQTDLFFSPGYFFADRTFFFRPAFSLGFFCRFFYGRWKHLLFFLKYK